MVSQKAFFLLCSWKNTREECSRNLRQSVLKKIDEHFEKFELLVEELEEFKFEF
jgi:hypothetical protein